MLYKLLMLCIIKFAAAQDGAETEMGLQVTIKAVTTTGLSWEYQVINPDLDSPAGKVYWAIEDPGGDSLAAEDLVQGLGMCPGFEVQVDDAVHTMQTQCAFTPGQLVKLLVAADYNGDGTQPTDVVISTVTVPLGELHLTFGVGADTVTTDGFDWTYHITNPDLDGDVGKVYWVLTADGVTMTASDIRAGSNPLQTQCFGSALQEDELIHSQHMNCPMVLDTKYLLWVAVDYNGDGTQAFTTAPAPVTPKATVDCSGEWGPCDSTCTQEYEITVWPSGPGAQLCTIGDGDVQTCAPGEGDCPPAPTTTTTTIAAQYSVANPTPDGFDLTLTPDPNAVIPAGKFYYMVTPVGATPTAPEVQAGSGGLCGGAFDIESTASAVKPINCPLDADTYDVWVAEDPQGTGTPVLVNPMKQVVIPPRLPVGNLYAHSPTATGFKLSYDIDNPNTNGNFYYKLYPTGSPSPSAADVRACTTCCGAVTQTDPAPMTTIDVPCTLTAGTTYDVWGEVDTDKLGSDASLANSGVAFTFTYNGATTAPTSQPPITTTTTPTGPSTSVITTNAPLGSYKVLYAGQYCETDEIADAVLTQDMIVLPSVRLPTGTSDIAACAGYVAANRAVNGGCSTLFHTGGPSGICTCVRLGYVCDRDESEVGQSIFQLCLTTQTCTQQVIYPDIMLNQLESKQGDNGAVENGDKSSSPEYPVAYLALAATLSLVTGLGAYFLRCKSRDLDVYHIALDGKLI